MNLEPGSLSRLTRELASRAELGLKEDIQVAARAFGRVTKSAWVCPERAIENGDDAAALPSPDGSYTLLAAEGMRSEFVAADPWFSGFCSVMVNVNDIAAMGGRPWAIVDVLFLGGEGADRVLEGMTAASAAFGVPIVGGHTSRVAGPTLLAAAVLGRATHLISGSAARPGQVVLAAIDLKGSFRGQGGNWNAATTAPGRALRAQIGLLAELAEADLVRAGKDISMAGLAGTLLMMLETSGCGAVLDVGAVPAPPGVEPRRWLTAFPSYGFLLAVDAKHVSAVSARFDAVGVACAPVGEITDGRKLELAYGAERAEYRDLGAGALTGFGG